jgi:hypothetical protein
MRPNQGDAEDPVPSAVASSLRSGGFVVPVRCPSAGGNRGLDKAHRVRRDSGHGASRTDGTGLPALPLPRLWQALMMTMRRGCVLRTPSAARKKWRNECGPFSLILTGSHQDREHGALSRHRRRRRAHSRRAHRDIKPGGLRVIARRPHSTHHDRWTRRAVRPNSGRR